MGADASIYGQIRAPQPTNRLADLAQAMQVQGLQGQNQLAQYGLRKAQRGDEETNALAEALRAGLDLSTTEGQRQAYGVAPTIAPTYIKTNTEARTADANLRKTNMEVATKAVEQHRASMPSDPQGAAAWMQAAYANPELKSITSTVPLDQALARIPTDPAAFKQWQQQMALGMTKFIEMNKPSVHMQDAGGVSNIVSTPGLGGAPVVLSSTQKTQTPDSVASTGLGYAKLKEDARHHGVVEGQGAGNKPPAGYRAKPDGTLEFIPGGPADPSRTGELKLTEDQGKATGWLVQAENAYKNMLSATDPTTGKPSAATPGPGDALAAVPGMGAAGNWLRSDNRQKFVQGASSLSEALLRAATGAGVNKDEAKQKIQELTPQWGDSAANIKQKTDAIPLYIESLKVRAGPGAKRAEAIGVSNPPATGGGPKPGAVQDGYRFKGGNPADKSSWEKV